MMKSKGLKPVLHLQFTWPVQQSWQNQSAAFWTMEEIYANVDCAKLSYPTPSTNYTGEKEVAENKTDVSFVMVFNLLYSLLASLIFSFFRSKEL